VPIAPLLAVAAFLPICFSIIALLVAWRSIAHRWLFLVVTLLCFSALHEIAFRVIVPTGLNPAVEHAEMIGEATRAHFIADAVSATLGGLLAWQLARALRTPP
jgi:hypothetical protein